MFFRRFHLFTQICDAVFDILILRSRQEFQIHRLAIRARIEG